LLNHLKSSSSGGKSSFNVNFRSHKCSIMYDQTSSLV
jgi:hypothetical protein